MDLNKSPLFSALSRRMEWLGERQRVISQNVANADTPGYKPSDLRPQTFAELLTPSRRPRASVATTSANHIAPGQGATNGAGTAEKVRKYESSPSGNAVSLEEELIKMAETQIEFQTVTNLYRKHIGMLKTAIGRRNG